MSATNTQTRSPSSKHTHGLMEHLPPQNLPPPTPWDREDLEGVQREGTQEAAPLRTHRPIGKGVMLEGEHQPTAPVGPSRHPNMPPTWGHAAGVQGGCRAWALT